MINNLQITKTIIEDVVEKNNLNIREFNYFLFDIYKENTFLCSVKLEEDKQEKVFAIYFYDEDDNIEDSLMFSTETPYYLTLKQELSNFRYFKQKGDS